MSLFSRIALASTLLAAVLASTSFAQPPDRGRGGRDGGPGAGPDGRGGPGGRGGPEGRRGGPPPPEVLMRALPVLAALDANQDGKISKAEIENATAALKKLDKNNDGDLTEEEMRPDFAAMGGRGGPGGGPGGPGGRFAGPGGPGGGRGGDATATVDRFMQFDKNKDGKLSKDELSERMQGIIRCADKNDDGVATREELQAMAAQGMRGDRGRGPGGPGGGGPEGRRGGDASQFFARMFEERDANKDGKLSADEMPEQMKGRLEQIDTDKDGSVSREEMETMMSRMRRGGGAGRGGPEGGGRPGGDRPRRPESE